MSEQITISKEEYERLRRIEGAAASRFRHLLEEEREGTDES